MVPTHFHAILNLGEAVLSRYRNHGLTALVSNAAPLPQVTKEKIVAHFGEGVLHETYGSTEAGIVTNLRPPDQLRKKSCVGLPFVGNRLRLLDDEGNEAAPGEVGELFSTSPYLFNGYWNKPEDTAATMRGGWVSAGDMARRDEDDYIYIVDRKKDMIISGGVNVYPREVEDALSRHPAVREVAVVGVPDDYWGERIKAFVVPQPDAPPTAGGADRLRQGESRRLQGPQGGRFHRGAAAQPGRQGAEAGTAGDGRVSGGAGTVEHRFVACGERRVMVRRAGSGPPVLLLHESPVSSAAFVPLIGSLAERFTVIAPDTPGYGGSDPLALHRPQIADYADALKETVDALGLERVALFGRHTGAAIAIAFSNRYPERVNGVVLEGCPAFTPEEMEELVASYLPPFRPVWRRQPCRLALVAHPRSVQLLPVEPPGAGIAGRDRHATALDPQPDRDGPAAGGRRLPRRLRGGVPLRRRRGCSGRARARPLHGDRDRRPLPPPRPPSFAPGRTHRSTG